MRTADPVAGAPADANRETDTGPGRPAQSPSVASEVGEDLRSGHRLLELERSEIGLARQRGFEQLGILPPRYLDRSECPQVIGDELGIEQLETAGLQRCHQMPARDLG